MLTFKNALNLRSLGGDLAQILYNVKSGKKTMVFGSEQASRTHISSEMGGFLLYITEDKTAARKAQELLEDFYDQPIPCLPEKDDVLIHRKAYQQANTIERIAAIGAIVNQSVPACVVTAEALLHFLPKKQVFCDLIFSLESGKSYDLDKLVLKLVSLGYQREAVAESRGSFARNGDILSFYPPNEESPIRVSFFDDVIESIKYFQPESMMSTGTIDKVRLLPISDFIISEQDCKKIEGIIERKKKILPLDAQIRIEEIWGDISSKLSENACESSLLWLLPFVRAELDTVFEYLPEDTTVVFDDLRCIETKLKIARTEHKTRVKNLSDQGEVLKEHIDAICEPEVVIEKLLSKKVLGFGQLTSANGLFKPEAVFNLKTVPLTAYHMNYNALVADLKNFALAGTKVVLCCGQKVAAIAMRDSLLTGGIPCEVVEDASEDTKGIYITADTLHKGFNYSKFKLVIIGTDELIKKRFLKKTNSKKREAFSMPQCGDFVVHDYHGVGLCVGIERIKGSQGEKDYVVISYRDGKLYVPTDQMTALQRYGGSDKQPKLNKLGGQEFALIREKVKQSIKEMAFDLLQLYQKRSKTNGHKYAPDGELQVLFEDAFEFRETVDQLDAVAEIKGDMEGGKVMDRLLCGDVGYGKTEVALRGVFKTVIEGKQAAILAPTTILARQHFNTAMARFSEFGVSCVLLSRFQSKEEIKANLIKIKDGSANVVIATHRLLSSDVQFKDLGMLVLDEEQRFGVEHKEKIKLLKHNINVLTLSATPIPRTLNMALTGIRDISVLETPPESRIPVQTYVTELTDALLTDAISRELARGGQVFVLFNRVLGIEGFAAHISQLVPQASVIVGHGQMPDDQLEKNINAFYAKEANVLVSTTIIENGIDIPDANTLIICDADKLGLSALYQLRGRVGRSNKLAHAYFTIRDNKVLTENGHKRLAAIMDYTDFGSGFKIAMRDLEIRGAGNVLGKEQHGHIAKVGYDMYCKLLQETVDEMNGEPVLRPSRVEIVCDVDAYLSDDYVTLADNKLKIYKEIAEVKSETEAAEILARLREAYGEVPKPVRNLIDIALMKNLASMIGVKKIIINIQGAGIVFEDDGCFKNSNVLFAVGELSDECVLSATKPPSIIFNAKFLTNEKKMRLMLKFLQKTGSNFN